MDVIRPKTEPTPQRQFCLDIGLPSRASFRRPPTIRASAVGLLVLATAAADARTSFVEVFPLLKTQCGECHVTGQADGPWSVDASASQDRFAECLTLPPAEQPRCTTYLQLTESPGPGIPAWMDLQQGVDNAVDDQACKPSASFHLGHSLADQPDAALCESLWNWLEAGLPP